MEKKKVLKLASVIVAILLVALLAISTTQSYFNKDTYAKNPTEYQTGLLSIDAVSKSNNISLSNTLPMSDNDGASSEPYVFTIKNNGNVDYKFNIKLLSTSSNTFSPEFIKLKVDDDNIKTLSSITDSIIKKDVVLLAGETIDITLRVWLGNDTTNDQIGKTFNSKIVIDGQSIYTSTNQEVSTLTLDYDTNGGSGTISSEKVKGNKITLSSVKPTKSGYTFLGWSTNSAATEAEYKSGDTITIDSNTKLYAIWKAASYSLTLSKGTGVSTIYYRINGATSYSSTTSSKTLSVNYGTTYYYYGTASTGYKMSSCTSTSPCSGTMGTSAVTKTLSASVNSYNLTLSKGTGVGIIYYRINGATSYSSTTSSKTLSVNYGTTYYYYGVASTGYKMSSCTSTSPCSGTMGASTTSRTLSASVNSYSLTLSKGTGVSTIYYRINGATTYTSTTSSKTLSVNYGTTYYYYGIAATGYGMSSCTSTLPCSGTMGTSAVTKTLSANVTYTVTIMKNLDGSISTLETVNVVSGGSYSKLYSGGSYYSFESVSCTNGQSATITEEYYSSYMVDGRFKISNVTSNTVCTIKVSS